MKLNLIPKPNKLEELGGVRTLSEAELLLQKNDEIAPEGYRLTITEARAVLEFSTDAGAFYGRQTLRQLNLGKRYGVHVSSILRGGNRLNIPDGNYIIFPCDRLQVIGSDDQLAKFSQSIENEVFGEDIDMEKREMRLRQLIIGNDSPFVGKTLAESGIRDLYSCMVVGLEEGKENLSSVPPTRRFQEGDIIWVVGEEEALMALLHNEE